MRRDRLRTRKLLRELGWYGVGVGGVLVFFDWLICPLVWSGRPLLPRLAIDLVGAALVFGGGWIGRYNQRLGRKPASASPPET